MLRVVVPGGETQWHGDLRCARSLLRGLLVVTCAAGSIPCVGRASVSATSVGFLVNIRWRGFAVIARARNLNCHERRGPACVFACASACSTSVGFSVNSTWRGCALGARVRNLNSHERKGPACVFACVDVDTWGFFVNSVFAGVCCSCKSPESQFPRTEWPCWFSY